MTVDCPNDPSDTVQSGSRLWIDNYNYFVIIGLNPDICYALAAYGRKAKNVTKYWDEPWASQHSHAAYDAGYNANDDHNMYYIYGDMETCVGAIEDMCERTEQGLKAEGHHGYQNYNIGMFFQIMDALELYDDGWKDARRRHSQNSRAARAKDVVLRGNGFQVLRDGTRRYDNGWGIYVDE